MNTKSIAVDQLIYTRVEEEYSREGQAGFQTFYHSGLPQPIVSAVEQRVRRFDVSHKNARRFQFFTLGNKVILSHSVPIESHPQIIDKSHRPGAFLAHCLIYNIHDFKLCFQNDPFIVLDTYPFLKDAVEMVEQFENPGSTMRQKKMPLFDIVNDGFGKPAFAAIPIALHLLTSDAQCPLFIRLKPQSVLNFLKFLFRLLPADRRLEFSFDSCVDRYPIKPEWYIICESAETLDSGFKYIDARHIRNKKYNPHEMESLSASWLSYVYNSGRLQNQNRVNFLQMLEVIQTIETDARTTGRFDLDEIIELMTDSEVIELITYLVQVDAKQHLTQIISRIKRFDLKLIKHLEKILRRQKDIPSIVNQTINDTKSRLQAQTPNHRFWFVIV